MSVGECSAYLDVVITCTKTVVQLGRTTLLEDLIGRNTLPNKS